MACSPGWRQALHRHPGSALQGQQGRVEPSALCTGYAKGPKKGKKKTSVKTPTYHHTSPNCVDTTQWSLAPSKVVSY